MTNFITRLFELTIYLLICKVVFAEQPQNYEHLQSTREIYIKKDGTSKNVFEEVYKVATESGRSELSIQKVYFQQGDETFKLLSAYSVTKGKINLVSEKNLQLAKAPSSQFALTDLMEVSISFSNISIGSEVHLRYEISSRPYIGSIFSKVLGVSNSSLAKKEYTRITSEIPLQSYTEEFGDYFSFDSKRANDKFVVEIGPTKKAYDLQSMVRANAVAYLTTATSWLEIERALAPNYLSKAAASLPPQLYEIRQKSLGLKTKKEVIEFAAQEINKLIAYSGTWTNRTNKMFPAEMKDSLKNGKGDCKDYSTLLVALLKSLNFEAHPFLTFRSRTITSPERLRAMSQVANPAYFNHVIVKAKDSEGKVWWIDPTNPYVQADVITTDILGNFGITLGNKMTLAEFLPSENPTPSDFKMEQTITLLPDNSVTGTGTTSMSASTYNLIAMQERQLGPEQTKKIFSYIINPLSKDTKIEIKKSNNNMFNYQHSFHGADWVKEVVGKSKTMTYFNTVALHANGIRTDADGDLGEAGTTTIISHIKNVKEVDTAQANCLIRSPWLDADRYVENQKDELLITDIIKVKKRFISKREAAGDSFDAFVSSIWNCSNKNSLTLNLEERFKSADDKANEKLKGPPLETMKDADAEKLFNLEGGQIYSYRNLKLYRYYEAKVNTNPKDHQAYSRMASTLLGMGYTVGDSYIDSYVEEALNLLELAIKHSQNQFTPLYYTQKTHALLVVGRKSLAIQTFNEMHKRAPRDIQTYFAAAQIAKNQKNLKDSEKWLLASQPLIKTQSEKTKYHALMASTLVNQGKFRESIFHYDALLKMNPNNPWGWHNLALIHLDLNELDRCIELEKKALELASFGAATDTIAKALVLKSEMMATTGTRQPSQAFQVESLLLEALKYDPKNTDALVRLAERYLILYKNGRQKKDLIQGQQYLKKAATIAPTNQDIQKLLIQFREA